jgi:DnaJ-class molecular chaperone
MKCNLCGGDGVKFSINIDILVMKFSLRLGICSRCHGSGIDPSTKKKVKGGK